MYCFQCRYELSGLPAGVCPECGRRFDPADPGSYRLRPSLLTAAQRRRLILWAGIPGGFTLLWALGPLPYAACTQVDLRSGRERTVHRVFEVPVRIQHQSTGFSEFVEAHLEPLAPAAGPPAAMWRTAHRYTPFSDIRVCYIRTGGIRLDFRTLHDAFVMYEVPLEDRRRLAATVLGLASGGGYFNVQMSGEGIEIRDAATDAVIDSWTAPP
jgi:hypothetical protein